MCGTILRSEIIKKTRKSHRCFGCSRIIPKGTMADYTVSVDVGDLAASYMCLDCCEFIKTSAGRNAAEDDGCLYPGAFRDAKAPYVSHPILEPI